MAYTKNYIESLTASIYYHLSGFSIPSSQIKQPEVGVIDVPLFGLRFKTTTQPKRQDEKFRVIIIEEEDKFDTDQIFLELAKAGYLVWLREKKGSYTFQMMLEGSDRWKKLVESAKKKALSERLGDFRVGYLNQLLREGLADIYHRDPSTFDWILL